jgi:glycosyltransferase involved in cell wall biosynthesis
MVNSLDTAVWGRVIASALSIPLVLTSHEHAPEDEEFGAGRAALGYYYLAPELIIAGSEFYWSRAVRYAREGTVVLLHHGVDTDSLRRRPDRRAATRAALGVTDDQIVVVCPGRFKHRKNQQLLLRAVARLTRPVREQVTVVFLGSVSSASNAYLRGMMSLSGNLGLSDRVIIRTDVAQSGMLDFYDAADVTAVPSLEEGLGYVVLEAMAAGCPVITSPVPGIREILELDHSCAAIADVDDEASWSRTLTSLVEDAAQRAAFGGAGHRLVLENFSEDVMIDALESKLFALTDGPPTNAPADATLRVNPGAYRAGPIVKAGRTDD